jgi:hypothetical protein
MDDTNTSIFLLKRVLQAKTKEGRRKEDTILNQESY